MDAAPLSPHVHLCIYEAIFDCLECEGVCLCVVADITPMFTEIKMTLNGSEAAVRLGCKTLRGSCSRGEKRAETLLE